MNPLAFNFAMSFIQNLPGLLHNGPVLVKAGIDLAAYTSQTYNQLQTMRAENRGPTNEEWEAQRQFLQKVHQALQAP